MSTKGMRLRSFTVNEKLKIVKEAEETSNCSMARLVRYFLFIFCADFGGARLIRVNRYCPKVLSNLTQNG